MVEYIIMDPMIFVLKKFILNGFYKKELDKEQKSFLDSNILKHRKALWITLLGSILVCLGLQNTSSPGTLINGLIAPVMVTGGAWFAVSFAGVPQRFIDIAIDVTFWMFTAFLLSLSTMFIAIGTISNFWINVVLVIIYFATLKSCIIYDTTDGFKAGLDEAAFKHSKAALLYYSRSGINVEKEK